MDVSTTLYSSPASIYLGLEAFLGILCEPSVVEYAFSIGDNGIQTADVPTLVILRRVRIEDYESLDNTD